MLVGVALYEAPSGATTSSPRSRSAVARVGLGGALPAARARAPASRGRSARASRRSSERGLPSRFALALTWLVPTIGLDSRTAERAVLALVAFGLVTAATRRATLFQVMGIVLVENGLALAALELPGGASLVIELGVAFDLTLIALVAGVFHERIFAEFGAGDSAALRSLRD